MGKIKPLRLADAQRLLDVAVAERGEDYVDPNNSTTVHGGKCRYRTYNEDGTEDGPDCGVGCVLHKHGYTVEDLTLLDEIDFGAGAPAARINKYIPGALTGDAASFLQDFQSMQDAGRTWGDARAFAHKELAYRQRGRD